MNLDDRIIQKRGEALSKGSLDINMFDDTVNVHMIYADIEREAMKLKPIGDGKYEAYMVNEAFASHPLVDRLRGVDERMKRFRFYRLYVREVLKKFYKRRNKNQLLDVRPILGLGHEAFVQACYEKVLQRDPDPEGARYHINRLHNREISKLELIYEFEQSEEGRCRGIRLRGKKGQYRFLHYFRKLFRIPIAGRVLRFVYNLIGINRVINSLVNWNRDIEGRIGKLEQTCDTLKNGLHEQIESYNELQYLLEGLQRQYQEQFDVHQEQFDVYQGQLDVYRERTENLEENTRNNNILLEKDEGLLEKHELIFSKYGSDIDKLNVQISNLKADFINIRRTGSEEKMEKEYGVGTKKIESDTDSYYSIDYFDFENRFRGSQEHVKEMQRIYLPYFMGCKNVIDIGCGRGEFVQLLNENGIGVTGVDIYLPYVEYCKMNHLSVFHGDGVGFLKQQEQVDGIFVGQVVEHISVSQIIELCAVAYEKLTTGSYLIMETPNPKSLAIYTEAFYQDPSHNKPVHPETLKYLVEKRGFSDVQILYTEGSRLPYHIPSLSDDNEGREHEFDLAMQRVEELLYGSQDYAIIAKK